MRLNNLIAFSLIHILCINYVDTIWCHVCNSVNNTDCEQNQKSKTDYKRECDEVLDERLAYYNYNKSLKQINNYSESVTRCEFCEEVEKPILFSKCRTVKIEIKDYIGDDEKRTIRDCAGVFSIDNGCHYTKRNHYTLIDCVCDSDGCNDDVNRLYNNAYVTVFFLVISFLFN